MKKLMRLLTSMAVVLAMTGIFTLSAKAADTTNLASLEPEKISNADIRENLVDSNGKTYSGKYIFMDSSLNVEIEYKLNQKYHELSGLIVVPKNATSGLSGTVEFYGDGKRLYKKTEIKYGSKISFKVSVAGVKKLVIKSSNQGTWGNGFTALVNTKLSQKYALKVEKNLLTMSKGDSMFINYSVTDNGKPSSKKPTFKSSNAGIAKVSSAGKLVAVSTGVCTITLKLDTITKKVTVVVEPGKVGSVKQISKMKNSVQIQWSQVKGASGYQVYMYDKDLEEYSLEKTISSGGMTQATLSGLKKNSTYKVKVRAFLKNGSTRYYGSFSKVINVKTSK